MMWRMSLTRPGLAGRPASSQASRLLPPFQARVVKPEDLDLDAAALERAREDIAADRRDGDRPAAHRAGIVDQQRHHGVAEIGVALDLEAQRLQRVGDDAGQPRRVEQALFEVEFPAAVLLRHQPALQLVGEPRHGAGEVFELLVEQGPQLVEFLGRAEFGGLDDLVELLGEDLVVELVGEFLGVGAGRRRVGAFLAGFAGLLLVGLGDNRSPSPRLRRSPRCRPGSGPPRPRRPRSRPRPARASCRRPAPRSRAPGRRPARRRRCRHRRVRCRARG